MDIKPSYDLSSDKTPIIATISTSVATRVPAIRLHTSHTDWELYQSEVSDKLTTKQKLKTREDIELATADLLEVLQQAVKTATQVKYSPRRAYNLPTNIKQLVAQKRRARAKWQRTHTPEDKRLFNNANNKLGGTLQEKVNATFAAYIATLKREYQTTRRPIKSRKKPRTPLPPIRTNTRPPGPWAKSDTEKANLFANHLAEVYKPHDDAPDQEILRELETHAQHIEKPRAFTLGELTGVIKHLHPRKAPGPDLVTPLMIQQLPPEGLKAILHLLNAITRLEYWPNPLKKSKGLNDPRVGGKTQRT
jgi:hypothetical protein